MTNDEKKYNEAMKKYINAFGGFPYFLCMGMDPDTLMELVNKAIETGEEIKPVPGRTY